MRNQYVISVRGEAREQYIIEAASEEEARAKFEVGDLPRPSITEIYDAELVSIDIIARGAVR